jgi:SAM-dependent methyltransferase
LSPHPRDGTLAPRPDPTLATTPAGAAPRRADYGLDAPGVVRNLALGGAALVGFGAYTWWSETLGRSGHAIASIALSVGATYIVTSGLMVASSRVGKLRARDAILDRLALTPDARVLDVGCGHGLLLIGAARRTPDGRAVGLDLWSATDQQDNSREATLANAAAEGVAERVEVHDGDMCAMPFADASFDAVVSSLAIHNISDRARRGVAIGEIARVLRPGGRVAILDIAHVGQYAADLRAAGFREVARPRWSPWIVPPARVVVATK